MCVYSQFVEIGYVLLIGFGNAPSSGRIYRALASLAIASLLGVFIAAVQLLPTFDLLQHSVRSNTNDPWPRRVPSIRSICCSWSLHIC